jgi:cysteine-S-conjugate beta-lyase
LSGKPDAAAGPSTRLIHDGYEPPPGFAAPQPGVHKASTVIFPSVAALRSRDWRRRDGYTYGLHGTPTTFTLEERISALTGARHTVLLPSGLAAVTLVGMALLSAGDELLLPANVYGPSREFARHELARWGITHRLYDPLDVAGFAAMLGPKTRLVWLEAPGSVTMEFPDLAGLAAAARAAGMTTALDDTWGSGIAIDGFGAGVDIVMQALTKYASGGGDVLMGSVSTRDDALHEKLKLTHMHLGFGVGANDVEAVLRGLPSLHLRYAAQDAAGRRLAQWMAARPEVARVLHPALPGSPGHEHWQQQAKAAAGLFSVVFEARYGAARVAAFCDALRLFKLGYSWAGPVSLVVPYDLAAMRQGGQGELVRFSVGLEDVADLEADLEQALVALRG